METSINHSQEQNRMEEQNKETEDMNSPINQRYLTEMWTFYPQQQNTS